VETSVSHCGTCGTACGPYANATPTCTGGMCGFVCTTGFDNCDGAVPNGCEINYLTDPANCGKCDQLCAEIVGWQAQCVAGSCTYGCAAGYADCNLDTTDGCEVLLKSDPQNCGACGHDCKGGGCSNGVCQPSTVASNQAKPHGITLDGTNVYWTTEGTGGATGRAMMRVKTFATGPTALAPNLTAPRGILVGGDGGVYVALMGDANLPGAILKLSPSGGSFTETTFAANQSGALYLATTSSHLYWTRSSMQLTRKGYATGSNVENVATSPTPPKGIAVDTDGWVYWTNPTDLLRAQVGGTPQVVVTGGTAMQFLVLDPNSVYWTSDAPVRKAFKEANQTPVDLSGTIAGGAGIALDGGFLYWCGGGSIYKMPVAGGTVTTLAQGQSSPLGIAVDPEFVYWTNNVSSGSVMRVVKN